MQVDSADIEFNTLDVSHREDGWQKRFIQLVDHELSQPFSWSNAHCADLMACAVMACYGLDHPVLQLLQKYSGNDKESALKYLRELRGFETILGEYFVEVPTSHAFQADLALFYLADDSLAGGVVCDGQLVARRMDSKRSHAFRVPLTKAHKIYRV